MGAKQSKRSVDISGKEAESAGEVAAAGAGGEGRVEPLADADALKPQLNGDAHIQPPQEITDKEKQLDVGTPENEKDATTEKEGKDEPSEEKENPPLTNGDSETKPENGDTVPTPEDGKKPKKEKVKKKWSLRSISFSRKDKPKQEKKQKEDEPKLNGEPEKVPEEAAEANAESAENKIVDVNTDSEVKEEKTPETPVTEPLTNGSSTPESPKAETPVTEEPATASPEVDRSEAAVETKPEQLPINGLSLEEQKKETPDVAETEESKPEETTAVATETAATPEIVKTEVCVAKMPLIESTPPPLPANPPPSSVASFAATTMAPELIDASLANTTENAIMTPPAILDTKADTLDVNQSEQQQNGFTNNDNATSQLSPPLKETLSEDKLVETTTDSGAISKNLQTECHEVENEPKESVIQETVPDVEPVKSNLEIDAVQFEVKTENVLSETNVIETETANVTSEIEICKESEQLDIDISHANVNNETTSIAPTSGEPIAKDPEPVEELLPPPSPLENVAIQKDDSSEVVPGEQKENLGENPNVIDINTNHVPKDEVTNGAPDETEKENVKNKNKDSLGNIIPSTECNGNAITEETEIIENGKSVTTPSDSMPPSLSEATESSGAGCTLPPPPPAELSRSGSERSPSPSPPPPPPADDTDSDSLRQQDPLPISDKMADLLPEIPSVPELKNESLQETATEVAVAD